MFCTASFSSFLFLTLAWTRWSKHAVFFTLVLNCEADTRSYYLQIIHMITTCLHVKQKIHMCLHMHTHTHAHAHTRTLPPGLDCYQAVVNRHIHQTPLIASHPWSSMILVPMETRFCYIRTRFGSNTTFLEGETSSFSPLSTQMQTNSTQLYPKVGSLLNWAFLILLIFVVIYWN